VITQIASAYTEVCKFFLVWLREDIAILNVRCDERGKYTELKIEKLSTQQRAKLKACVTHSAKFTLKPTLKGVIPVKVLIGDIWYECRSTFTNYAH
jgi:hypothetical protein